DDEHRDSVQEPVVVRVRVCELRRDVRDVDADRSVRIAPETHASLADKDFAARLRPCFHPLVEQMSDLALDATVAAIPARHLLLPQLAADEPALLAVVRQS